jgi:acyl-CoA thioesterase-1
MRWLVLVLALAGCGGGSKSGEVAHEQAAPPPAPPADARPVIVAFGDSLTDGFGVANGEKYTDYLQAALDARKLAYRVVNAGVSGDTTGNALDRLPGVLALKPKLVILEIGGNDGLRGLPVEQTERNLEEIVKGLQAGGARLLMWGMTLPRNYGPRYVRDFERMYETVAKRYRVTLIPVREFGQVEMQPDGIHPTGAGYARIAPVVFKYVERELAD